MKERFRRFMQGRYGVDEFSRFLSGAGLVCMLIATVLSFFEARATYYISSLCMSLAWFCLLWSRGGLGKPRHGAKLRSIGIAMLFGFANHRFCPAHVPELGDRDGIVCVGHPIIVRGSIDEGQTLFILRGSRFPVLP